jgi:hypothetical protein
MHISQYPQPSDRLGGLFSEKGIPGCLQWKTEGKRHFFLKEAGDEKTGLMHRHGLILPFSSGIWTWTKIAADVRGEDGSA